MAQTKQDDSSDDSETPPTSPKQEEKKPYQPKEKLQIKSLKLFVWDTNELSASARDLGLHYETVEIAAASDHEFENSVAVKTLFDSGNSHNTLDHRIYKILLAKGAVLPATRKQVDVDLARSKSFICDILETTMWLKLNLSGVPLTTKATVTIIEGANDEFSLGIPFLKEHRLLSYVENPLRWAEQRLPPAPKQTAESSAPADLPKHIQESVQQESTLEGIETNGELAASDELIRTSNEQLDEVIAASVNHSDCIRIESIDKSDVDEIQVGDCILATDSDPSPSKLSAAQCGSSLVIKKVDDNGFVCQDCETQKQFEMAKHRVKKLCKPVATDATAGLNHDANAVESIVDFRGDKKTKSTWRFLVKWFGHDTDYRIWEPWEHVEHFALMQDFLANTLS